jgi:hypothetical protein
MSRPVLAPACGSGVTGLIAGHRVEVREELLDRTAIAGRRCSQPALPDLRRNGLLGLAHATVEPHVLSVPFLRAELPEPLPAWAGR